MCGHFVPDPTLVGVTPLDAEAVVGRWGFSLGTIIGITGWTRGDGREGAECGCGLGGVLLDSRICGFGLGAARRATDFSMSARLRRSDVSALLERLFEDSDDTGTNRGQRQWD